MYVPGENYTFIAGTFIVTRMGSYSVAVRIEHLCFMADGT